MLIALDSGLDQTMVVIGLKAFRAGAGRRPRQPPRRPRRLARSWPPPRCSPIHYIDPLLSDVVPFLVLIAMLIVRPWGLFGTREELDRV